MLESVLSLQEKMLNMLGLFSFPTYMLLETTGDQNIVFDGILVQISMIRFVHRR